MIFCFYRFSKRTVVEILLPMVEPIFPQISRRGCGLPPILKLLAVLRFYATGSFQVIITWFTINYLLIASELNRFFEWNNLPTCQFTNVTCTYLQWFNINSRWLLEICWGLVSQRCASWWRIFHTDLHKCYQRSCGSQLIHKSYKT